MFNRVEISADLTVSVSATYLPTCPDVGRNISWLLEVAFIVPVPIHHRP